MSRLKKNFQMVLDLQKHSIHIKIWVICEVSHTKLIHLISAEKQELCFYIMSAEKQELCFYIMSAEKQELCFYISNILILGIKVCEYRAIY